MFRAYLLMGFGVFTVAMALFVWALCRIAAISDARIDPKDCFSRYRLHVKACSECQPVHQLWHRCPIGQALWYEATGTLRDKELERMAEKC